MIKKKNEITTIDSRTCGDCSHHYDEHEIGANGKPFLCKCPFFRWDRFLNNPKYVCKNFKA